MTTLLITHPACLDHNPGAMHPESPSRLRAILKALEGPEFADLLRREAPAASVDQIARAHARAYVTAVLKAVPPAGLVGLDADTVISPGSGEAALRAAGAVVAGVDAVMTGEADNAFCAVRPPGHHAEAARAMGFCLFNNVAIGAAHARAAHGLERVAVVDFDVHHGNGTQHMFERDPGLFYASTHQWPLYPGTGDSDERGVGNVCNVPLPPMAGSREFRAAMETIVLPALAAFRPDLLMVSAGFDAHAADPLASLRLVEADYDWATRALMAVADDCCEGRLVSTLEGGYDLPALAASAAAHLRAL
ncbi:MAG TPA: histone deacetylase family protein, partial [Dongiaceae bacterium]|nr:histone deacetylase family protein [Dongiaceae bacterium]